MNEACKVLLWIHNLEDPNWDPMYETGLKVEIGGKKMAMNKKTERKWYKFMKYIWTEEWNNFSERERHQICKNWWNS